MNTLINSLFGWKYFLLIVLSIFIANSIAIPFYLLDLTVVLTVLALVHFLKFPMALKSIFFNLLFLIGLIAYFLICKDSYEIKLPFYETVNGFKRKLITWTTYQDIDVNTKGLFLNLIIADRSMMSKALLADFRSIGGAHLIALSGMHLGIVYFFLEFLTKWLNLNQWLKGCILLILLFMYAVLAGMQIPILRAFLMISIMILVKMVGKKRNSIDQFFLLLGSMLILFPKIYENWGFQFSFAGVMGILFGMKYLAPMCKINNKWLNFGCQFILVSCFAQLTIFPLIWFNIGEFPVYFLLTNILLSPLVFLLVITGLCVLGLKTFGLEQIGFQVLELETKLLLIIVDWIKSLPYYNVSLNSIQLDVVVLWYLGVFQLLKLVLMKSVKHLFIFTCILFYILKKSFIL